MINKILQKYFENYYRQVEHFMLNPISSQENVLSDLLKNGQNSLIGEEFKFSSIKNKDIFKKNIPIFEYENFYPYLEKIIRSKQQNYLWNSPTRWFAMSSGTTENRSKYIPVTTESLIDGHYKCGKQMLAIYLKENPDSKFLFGKTLLLGGSRQINDIGDGIFTGDISAILIKNSSILTKYSRTPKKIALIPDWEEKLQKLAIYASNHDIRALMGVPSWLLILLKKIKAENNTSLSSLWPNLEVFFHGGVSFTPFEEQYKKLIDTPQMKYWEVYNASEGFFGVQLDNTSKEMLLMLDSGIYYEFLPLSELKKNNPQTLTLDEVETHQPYALIISTNGGLWRYMLGDTIIFTSKYPFLFKITGRTKNFINAFGEELTIDNAEKALAKACKQTQSQITEYTAGPVYFGDNHTGAHEWYIEFNKPPVSFKEFANQLDESLMLYNSDYAAKRSHNLSLNAPIINILPSGTFNSWLKSNGKMGGQNKVPRLSNHRDFLEKLKDYIEKENITESIITTK